MMAFGDRVKNLKNDDAAFKALRDKARREAYIPSAVATIFFPWLVPVIWGVATGVCENHTIKQINAEKDKCVAECEEIEEHFAELARGADGLR